MALGCAYAPTVRAQIRLFSLLLAYLSPAVPAALMICLLSDISSAHATVRLFPPTADAIYTHNLRPSSLNTSAQGEKDRLHRTLTPWLIVVGSRFPILPPSSRLYSSATCVRVCVLLYAREPSGSVDAQRDYESTLFFSLTSFSSLGEHPAYLRSFF